MNKSTQIPAFSILEAVVSMVVSAIVIGLVFVIFTIITERMIDFKNQNQYIADMNRLTYSFNKDIFESEKMIPSDSSVVFYSYSGNITTYTSRQEYLLRNNQEFTDTFKIPVHRLKLDTVANKNRTIVFQRLLLNVDVNEQPVDLKFFKKIYADELLKTLKNEF